MPYQSVSLRKVSREDVFRISRWLEDDEVSDSWFGRYSYGNPAHLGYHPEEMEGTSDEEWDRIFEDSEHLIRSIYTEQGEHIGETHIAIEESLGDGHASILIGQKNMWHQGYGTAGMNAVLELAFDQFGLYRIWVDIPEYNVHALSICTHLGFVHEGTLRKSRPHEGARFDSAVMGILSTEYAKRVGKAGL